MEAGKLIASSGQHLGPALPPFAAPSLQAPPKFSGPSHVVVISFSRFKCLTQNRIFEISHPDKMVAPEVALTHLNRADGSATYTYNGYSIIGAVNGPIEVQRRDEQPEEATLEVNVRPSAGVGSTVVPPVI